jgi:hypothetical protein
VKLVLAVPDLGQESFCVEELKDTVDGYFGNKTFFGHIIEGSIDYVIFIPVMEQPK